MNSRIAGSGHYVPDQIVTNEELAPRIGSTATWIEERTGIRERRWVNDGQTNSELGAHASRAALDDAGIAVEEVDAIVYATLSPDAGFPGSGVFLQRELGASAIPALDVRNQCSGFLYALSVAHAWVSTNLYETILVVGAEIHSTGLDISKQGRTVTSLFGDGAGAVVVQPGPGIREIRLGADGSGIEALWCELPASGLHPNLARDYLDQGRHYPKMQGRSVFRRAVETLERELKKLLADHDLAPEDVYFVPHQANRHLINLVADRVGIPREKIESTIEFHANTTAASIPIALDVARKEHRIQPGTTVVSAAFGSGYTWGCSLIDF